jgi:hypothetical protein
MKNLTQRRKEEINDHTGLFLNSIKMPFISRPTNDWQDRRSGRRNTASKTEEQLKAAACPEDK